jgi:hypothetical protein
MRSVIGDSARNSVPNARAALADLLGDIGIGHRVHRLTDSALPT